CCYIAYVGLQPFPTRRSSDLRGNGDENLCNATCSSVTHPDLRWNCIQIAMAFFVPQDAAVGAKFSIPCPRSSSTIDRAFLAAFRSEEHTSELQSLRHLVCRLL